MENSYKQLAVEKQDFVAQFEELSVAAKDLKDSRNKIVVACEKAEQRAQTAEQRTALRGKSFLHQAMEKFNLNQDFSVAPEKLSYTKILNLFESLMTEIQ